MKIYTKKGDKGQTSILGKGLVDKDDIRIEAYGTIDEVNSLLGMCRIKSNSLFSAKIHKIQNLLFEAGSDLASETPLNTINSDDIAWLESEIDQSETQLQPLKSFILPGGSEGSSWFHLARTVTRRAERIMVSMAGKYEMNDKLIKFINRLSDLFFSWSRLNNQLENTSDVIWTSRKKQ